MTRKALLAAACVLALAGPARASSGGAFEIERQWIGGYGAVMSTGTTTMRIAHQVGAGTKAGGGVYAALSGFYVEITTFVSAGVALPPDSIRVVNGVDVGVSTDSAVTLAFDVPMSSASLLAATTIYLLADNQGVVYDPPQAVQATMTYNGANADILPLGGWQTGGTYRVYVDTSAVDLDGNALPAPHEVSLQTVYDFTQDNVFTTTGTFRTRLNVPSGALGTTRGVIVSVDPRVNPDVISSSVLEGALTKAWTDLRSEGPVELREFNVYDASNQRVTGTFASAVQASIDYRDADGDGIADTSSRTRTKYLRLFSLDETSGRWVRVPGSLNDAAAGSVSAPLKHFSVYAVMAAADTEVTTTHPYPVPWRPNGGDAARYGTAAGGITFENLPQIGTIKIYTLSGRLVKTLDVDGALTLTWDVKNDAGEDVASGVYLWRIESGANVKTGKLAVIR